MCSIIIHDIANISYSGWQSVIKYSIIPFIIIFIFVVYSIRNKKYSAVIGYLFVFIVWLLIQLVMMSFTYSDYKKIRDARINNKCLIIMGYVNDVKYEYGRTNYQCFKVNNIQFRISDDVNNGGFNKTSLNGGPITEGIHVKVFYIESFGENHIARLEMLKKCE